MTKTLSSPITQLRERYDVVVVGSGYGGGIAASRLARAGKTVCLLERGDEKQPGDYPNDVVELLKNVQIDSAVARTGSPTAMFDVRYNKDINVVVGCGLGGTSLINAGICLRPDPRVLASDAWPTELRNEAVLDEFFGHAEDMLKPSVTPDDYLHSAKTTAFGAAAKQLNNTAVPVPILVNFQPLPSGVNHVGVAQTACVGCGDCVSGCNYGAKNTVLMNYLPDAKNHAAQIFTRVRARQVEKADGGWRVYGETVGDNGAATNFTVAAEIVILAAGTLGSTEILLRSARNGLKLSNQVGNHFSANGDTIGFAYNTDHEVNGIGLGAVTPNGKPAVGPCSTVMMDARGGVEIGNGMVMEDGAVPGALASVLAPLLAAGAGVLGTHDRTGLWEALRRGERDVQSELLGAYAGATRNTLFMLLITYDDSAGRMSLDNDRLRVDWPGLGKQRQFAAASELMRRASAALDGSYIPNPIWNDLTNQNLVTGHPLGGCIMADSADRGVVNHKSQVFSGDTGDGVHDGLYVMDGSVVPTALGVNPLLTISALAERSCYQLARDRGWVINYKLV
jgi:cholesterol oxidase